MESTMKTGKTLDVVNNFYDILVNRNGEGLADIITPDVKFNGPFFSANGSKEFLEGMQRWIQIKKTYNILKQFVDGNDVYSIYVINAEAPTGVTVSIDTVDWIKIRDGKIAEVKVYFDPREWANAIGRK